jgi:uncharacterized protein (TIGR02421 family)
MSRASAAEAPREAEAHVPDSLLDGLDELTREGRVSRRVEGWGRLYVDRPLPYLALHRRRAEPGLDVDTVAPRLVTAEASFLVAPGEDLEAGAVAEVVDRLAGAALDRFGAFLTLEVAIGSAAEDPDRPVFTVVAPQDQPDLEETVQTLRRGLEDLSVDGCDAEVHVERPRTVVDGFPLRPSAGSSCPGGRCFALGVRVAPVFRHPETGRLYPMRFDDLRAAWAAVLKETFYEFCRRQAEWTEDGGPEDAPRHPQALGRRGLSEGVERIDRILSRVAEEFEFLLGVTPVNGAAAWEEFRDGGYEETPELRYRPLTVDVEIEKRRLYSIPLEEIDDPTVSRLFREKQEELDRMLTMLLDRGTPRFLHGSLQVYGEIDPHLVTLAEEVLEHLARHYGGDDQQPPATTARVDARTFAERARREIAHYRTQHAAFDPPVVIREDLHRGIMVSRGRFLVGEDVSLPENRVRPLLHHEIGTHLLTYYNGQAQPFRQLYLGLAGYEAMQEGLAVFAEYLCDGLTADRLSTLAGRVVAVDSLIEGATFADTFRTLCEGYGFGERRAFDVVLRVYRGGGFTKDAVYLQGLRDLLAFLGMGGDIRPLYVGKIAETHVPVFEELRRRQVLRPVPLTPRFLIEAPGPERLQRAQAGLSLTELIDL